MGRFLRSAGLIALCCLAGAIGAFVTRRVGATNEVIPYADFITIMLTAVSVLLTALAIFLAVLGAIGWNSVRSNISDRASKFLEEGFREGNTLHNIVKQKTIEVMYQGVSPIMRDESRGDTE